MCLSGRIIYERVSERRARNPIYLDLCVCVWVDFLFSCIVAIFYRIFFFIYIQKFSILLVKYNFIPNRPIEFFLSDLNRDREREEREAIRYIYEEYKKKKHSESSSLFLCLIFFHTTIRQLGSLLFIFSLYILGGRILCLSIVLLGFTNSLSQ